MEFTGKAHRTQCYSARDAYFSCIERYKDIADAEAKKQKCIETYKEFEKICGIKWTEHFIKRRDYLIFKEKLEKEGITSLDGAKIPK